MGTMCKIVDYLGHVFDTKKRGEKQGSENSQSVCVPTKHRRFLPRPPAPVVRVFSD